MSKNSFIKAAKRKKFHNEKPITNASKFTSNIPSNNANASANITDSDNKSNSVKDSTNNIDSNFDSTIYTIIDNYSKKKPSFDELFIQQNVYLDKNLHKAVNSFLKTRKLTKKQFFNDAVKVYLQAITGKKIETKEEELS